MKIIQSNIQKQAARTRGLTLIELVVVLAILVALVGMVLAIFPNLIRQAGSAAGSSSVKELNNVMQVRFATAQTYGTGYDNLAVDANTLIPGLVGYVGNTGVGGLTIAAIPAADVTALNNIGINSVHPVTQVVGGGNGTFDQAQRAAVAPALAANANVAVLSTVAGSTGITTLRNLSPGVIDADPRRFYVFGVGPGCTLIGPGGLAKAPVRAGQNANDNPAARYAYYGVVFSCTTTGQGVVANLVGTVAFTANGVRSANEELAGYYQ